MASICHRCALRLRHATNTTTTRSFSSTAVAQKGGMPVFTESPNPELNEVLSTIRNKIFMPNYLEKGERKLLFKAKYRQQLIDNPQNVTIGDEELPLEPLDIQKDLPKRSKTVKQALDIIMDEDSKEWHQLPKLLLGLNEGVKRPVRKETYARVARCAINADKFGVILQCLETPDRTGMTLKNHEVLRIVLDGLHHMAQDHDWSEKATGRALRDANVVSRLLEREEHGGGRRLQENDPRARPETVGLFLELAAVYAYRHAGAQDNEGLVKAYAGRLVSCLARGHVEPQGLDLIKRQKSGDSSVTYPPQWPMLGAIRIWHGLTLAQKILGNDMPKNDIATRTIENYEARLKELAAQLESEELTPYGEQALNAWKACIRE